MTRKVLRSAAAAEDMLAIAGDVISDLGIEAALATDDRIDAAIESLATLGQRGRVVPELRLRGVMTYRELIALPYRIVYRVEPREIWIVAVLDHRRDLDQLLLERARRDREG